MVCDRPQTEGKGFEPSTSTLANGFEAPNSFMNLSKDKDITVAGCLGSSSLVALKW
jgi:hypothetical protein